MRTVPLVDVGLEASSSPKARLAASLARLQALRGKVYHTYVQVEEKKYDLVTTSKDVDLALGRFSPQDLQDLCLVLDGEFQSNDEDVLLTFGERGSIHVPRPSRNDTTTFYILSPAH